MDIIFKINLCFCLTFASYNINAMPIKYNTELSFLKVIISPTEFEYSKISNKEYSINSKYYLNSSFIRGVFNTVTEKLEAFKAKEASKPLLLEYITLGNGKKMITNIAIP